MGGFSTSRSTSAGNLARPCSTSPRLSVVDTIPEVATPRPRRLIPNRVELSPALEVSKRPSPFQRMRHLWRYRELLGNLVRKELKVKYKNSVLGLRLVAAQPAAVPGRVLVVFQELLLKRRPVLRASSSCPGCWPGTSSPPRSGRRTGSIVGNAPARARRCGSPARSSSLAVDRRRARALLPAEPRAARRAGRVPATRRTGDASRSSPARPGRAPAPRRRRSAIALAPSTCTCATPSTCSSWCCWPGSGCRRSSTRTPVSSTTASPVRHSAEWIAAAQPVIPIVITFQRAHLQPGDRRAAGRSSGPRASAGTSRNLASSSAGSLVLLFVALALFGRLEDNFAEEI